MQLSQQTVLHLVERWSEAQVVHDHASEYGEPGYRVSDDTTPIILFGDWWCRCDKKDGGKLHGLSDHHPMLFAQLEAQGVEFEWYDEWVVDHENDKAYRSEPDSYMWQPSYVLTDDCELLTPDDDIEAWIERAVDTPSRAIPSVIYTGADLVGEGFEQHNSYFESGWHPGQDDNPKVITEQIRRYEPDAEIVFVIDSTGQFDMRFSAYYRTGEESSSEG